ncbi:MAG: NAD(P)H-dependent oxidoreductase subunit E [Phycisphaerae bacterium]|jgi:NADH:ubiquinone oxidoreductase subunit E|nr:NAD(P)H-dependent oxidoreductase subunit E [Phycisphaerae bacterium]
MIMREDNGQERIGVYVCHCGTNISHTVDVKDVADYARGLPGVVTVREYKYMCSDPGQDMIKKDIVDDDLTRVVVSSCSPLMHEETFRNTCEDAGMNRFLFQMSNIREQCSWVHPDRAKATAKAKRLVAAAIRRVSFHKSLEQREAPVNRNTLIVGAGIAGIEAALKIADSGKKVYLVDKEPSIGGHMAKFDKTFPTLDCAACILTPKMVQVGQHPNIELMTYSEVEEVSGYVGNFKAKIRRRARFVDEEKCTGCGDCTQNCLVRNQAYLDPPVIQEVEIDEARSALIDRVVAKYGGGGEMLVPILQDINAELNWLPQEVLMRISQVKEVPLEHVVRIATFYSSFSLEPRGKHIINVCMGTACEVKGAPRITARLERELGINVGETTSDMKFTLEAVRCVGCCGLAPVIMVGDEFYGKLTPGKVAKLIDQLAAADGD